MKDKLVIYPLKAQHLIWVGLVLHVCVSFWNGFYGPSFGAEADASSFHNFAVEFSNNSMQGGTKHEYIYMLGALYYWTINSLFWGSLMSCLAWLVSASLLDRIMRIFLCNSRQRIKAMLLYILIPSAILFTSVTLREAYQLMFVNLMVYSALKILLHKSFRFLPILFAGIIGGGFFHASIFVFGLLLLIVTLTIAILSNKQHLAIKGLFILLPITVVIYFYASMVVSSTSYAISFSDGLIKAIENYVIGGLSYLDVGRAFYRDSVEIDGVMGLLLYLPVALFQYLFEPMVWRVSSAKDAFLVIENIIRFWLICKALRGVYKMPAGYLRKYLLLVFVAYLALETIFSVGTINWGTAARHHIPAMGLLIISAFAYEGRRIKRVFRSLEGLDSEKIRKGHYESQSN